MVGWPPFPEGRSAVGPAGRIHLAFSAAHSERNTPKCIEAKAIPAQSAVEEVQLGRGDETSQLKDTSVKGEGSGAKIMLQSMVYNTVNRTDSEV